MPDVDWRTRIVADREIAGGKPVIKGTRLTVPFLLGLLAAGWPESRILEEYPQLAADDLRACLAYAAELAADELVLPRPAA